MVYHYPLVEFLCDSTCSKIYKIVHHDNYVCIKAITIIASGFMLLYCVALKPPPRHQHPQCFHSTRFLVSVQVMATQIVMFL